MVKQFTYEPFLKFDTGTHTGRINQVLVTPDEKSLITVGNDKTIRIWDIDLKNKPRVLLGQIGPGPRGSIQRIALSPDGNDLVALAWMYPADSENALDRDTELRVYNLSTGNLKAGFHFRGTLMDLDFSPDGRQLVLAGNEKGTERSGWIYVYPFKSLRNGFGNIPRAKAKRILHKTNSLIPSLVRFIPERTGKSTGARIVAATWIYNGGTPEYTGKIKWFSFKDDKLTVTGEQDTEETLTPESLTVSREYVILTTHHGDNHKFYCHDHSGTLLKVMTSETDVAQPAFSKDEKFLIVGQRGDSALVQIKVYTVSLGEFQLKSTYYGHDAEAVAVALLENGTAVSAGGDQNTIHLWSTEHLEGEKISEIVVIGRTIHALGINDMDQIGVGTYDGLRYEDGRVVLQRLFDLQTMTLRPSTLKDEQTYHRAQTQFGNLELKWLDDNANLWLLGPGSRTMPVTGTPHPGKPGSWIWYKATTFGFTEKGTIITGAGDGKIRVAPRNQGGGYSTPLRLLNGFGSRVNTHAASAKWLATSGADQIIRLWFLEDVERTSTTEINPDEDTLEPALNLFIGSDDEWLIWSKSGYYSASQRGDRRMGYHINRGPKQEALYIPSDRFFKRFFHPDIIHAILEHGSEERALAALNQQGLVQDVDFSSLLPPIIELLDDIQVLKGPKQAIVVSRDRKLATIHFSVEVLNPKFPVIRVWIVQNNQFAWQEINPQTRKFQAKIRLTPGTNQVKILAETENAKAMPLIFLVDGAPVKSWQGGQAQKDLKSGVFDDAGASRGGNNPAQPMVDKLPASGRLFLLAVGVANLKNEKKDEGYKSLRFPGDDAISIYNAFGRSKLSEPLDTKGALKNKAFESVEARILLNEQATKAAIMKEVEDICSAITERAKKDKSVRDVFLVFLAGHGVHMPGDDLYFWNYEAEFDKLPQTGLSFIELGKKITCVPADVILATDACHSAIAGSDVIQGLEPNELAKWMYAINERGMYILNAARSEETAKEYEFLGGHGVFTRAILDALEQDSDPDMSMMGLIDSVQRHMRKTMAQIQEAQEAALKANTIKELKVIEQIPVFRMYGDLLPLTIYMK